MSFNSPQQPRPGIPRAHPVTLGYAGPATGRGQPPEPVGNPLLSIWLKPRRTMAWLLYYDPKKWLYLLPCAAILLSVVSNVLGIDKGPRGTAGVLTGGTLLVALGIGATVGLGIGLLIYLIFTSVVKIVCGWFGGTGTIESIRMASSWGMIPSIASSIVSLPGVLIAYVMLSSGITDDKLMTAGITLLAFGIPALVLGIWGIFTMSNTVAEASRFSTAWLGFAAILVSGVLIFAVLFGLIFGLIMLIR
jgi:hypothetical protein